MSGFIAIITKEPLPHNGGDFAAKTINLAQNLRIKSIKKENVFFAASWLKGAPLKGDRIFENAKWIALFAGDIIEHSEIPWREIIQNIEKSNFSFFQSYEGIFSITAFDRVEKKLHLIGDRRSQQPVYYFADAAGMYVSTEMATFCRMDIDIKFNEEWLWEYLFFNYPVGDTTFLKGVKRVLPASVIQYSQHTGTCEHKIYAPLFQKKETLLQEQEALENACNVFARRVPKYFRGANDIACTLTAGWDGRTILALAPNGNITPYTYGVPGCRDLVEGSASAEAAGFPHLEIPFDDAFIKDLPRFMLEVVYLSSGLERISRASLVHVYDMLTNHASRFPLTLSGIAVDMLFRGHAFVPYLVSDNMAKQFIEGEQNIDKDAWSDVFTNGTSQFEAHIRSQNEWLQDQFGEFSSTAHHLSYIVYILSTRHFCGELAIAKHYTTVRVPAWDSEIIELSYSIPQSTLSFSQFSNHKRGNIKEMILQAYLLKELAPRFAGIPVGHASPNTIMKGKLAYHLSKKLIQISNKLKFKKKNPPLEKNEQWINVIHRDFIDNLIFSQESSVREYLRDTCLNELRQTRDLRQIAWFATIEIILRLIKNRWEKFW